MLTLSGLSVGLGFSFQSVYSRASANYVSRMRNLCCSRNCTVRFHLICFPDHSKLFSFPFLDFVSHFRTSLYFSLRSSYYRFVLGLYKQISLLQRRGWEETRYKHVDLSESLTVEMPLSETYNLKMFWCFKCAFMRPVICRNIDALIRVYKTYNL